MSLAGKNKYTRLLSNTALFGISTFSSKILSFLLTRLYTSVLAVASYGIVDIVTACANLLIPLVGLGISNAVIRFGLEKGISKQGVFTGGLFAVFSGFCGLLLLWPALAQVSVLRGNLPFLYLYVLMSCLRTLSCQFVRAKMMLRLYAVDGILSTLYTVGFNVLFLVVLKMGTTGYLLSIIAADTLSTIGLFLAAGLHRYIRIKGFDKALYKSMLQYSLPLVPAAMFWWVTSASDRFFVAYMMDTQYNGLYAAANKLPAVVALFTTIFTEAWQLSAITDGQGQDREPFFSRIFSALMAVSFMAGAGLILFTRFIMRFLVAPSFFEAWRYVPILIVATIFSCLVTFLNSVYIVEKRSGLSLLTMMAGAVCNLAFNAILIPVFGVNGAAFSTMVSYLLVFVVRAVNTRRFLRINFSPIKFFINTLLIALEAFIMIAEPEYWVVWCALLTVAIVTLNMASLVQGIQQILQGRKPVEKT